MIKQSYCKRFSAFFLAVVMMATTLVGTVFATTMEDGDYNATLTVYKYMQSELSAAAPAFIETADITIEGDDASITFYVISPLPNYLDIDPSVDTLNVSYQGESYPASPGDKVTKTAGASSTLFGTTAGESYETIPYTVTLPKEALNESCLTCSGVVQAGMGGSTQSFDLYFSDYRDFGASVVTTYEGSALMDQFGKYNVYAQVEVTDNVISSVTLSADGYDETYENVFVNKYKMESVIEGLSDFWNGMTASDAESIYDVDVVTSATYSSRVARDAVMDALGLEYEEEIINVPESIDPGTYVVPVAFYTDIVYHSLVQYDRTESAILEVKDDGSMYLTMDIINGTSQEPLYVTEFLGSYMDNDNTADDYLSEEASREAYLILGDVTKSDIAYADEFFDEDTQVVTQVTLPLEGGLDTIYNSRIDIYVPAMNNLDGVMSGVYFRDGHFEVDTFAKIYWDEISDANSQSMQITATVAKNVSTGSVTIPESLDMGELSVSQDTVGTYTISVVVGVPDSSVIVSSVTDCTLSCGDATLVLGNAFGETGTATFTETGSMEGTLTALADDVAQVRTQEDQVFEGTMQFQIAWS